MEMIIMNMLKSMGFDPEQVKQSIINAAAQMKSLQEQLNRIENKIDNLSGVNPTVKINAPSNPNIN